MPELAETIEPAREKKVTVAEPVSPEDHTPPKDKAISEDVVMGGDTEEIDAASNKDEEKAVAFPTLQEDSAGDKKIFKNYYVLKT